MLKACSKCGKIHPYNYKCNKGRLYLPTEESKLRSTNAWTKKSIEIRKDAHGLCEVCKAEGIYTYKNLEVHHIIKVKDDSTKLLDNDNLICLCVEHHKKADAGEISIEYLRELVKHREGR